MVAQPPPRTLRVLCMRILLLMRRRTRMRTATRTATRTTTRTIMRLATVIPVIVAVTVVDTVVDTNTMTLRATRVCLQRLVRDKSHRCSAPLKNSISTLRRPLLIRKSWLMNSFRRLPRERPPPFGMTFRLIPMEKIRVRKIVKIAILLLIRRPVCRLAVTVAVEATITAVAAAIALTLPAPPMAKPLRLTTPHNRRLPTAAVETPIIKATALTTAPTTDPTTNPPKPSVLAPPLTTKAPKTLPTPRLLALDTEGQPASTHAKPPTANIHFLALPGCSSPVPALLLTRPLLHTSFSTTPRSHLGLDSCIFGPFV